MTPDDLLPDEPCAGTGSPARPECKVVIHVSWSPVFGLWLCANCRLYRTDIELRATREANANAVIDARMAARRAAGLGR